MKRDMIMIDSRTAPYAAFILRVVLGLLFLAHAGLKIFVFTRQALPASSRRSAFPAGLPTSRSFGNWQAPLRSF